MPSKIWRENHKKKCLDCDKLVHGVSSRCNPCANKFSFSGKEITDSHRKNLSLAHIGQIPWSKGKKMSDEFRRKISEIQKGKKQSEETKIKRSLSLTGFKHPPEFGKKISERNKGIPRFKTRGSNAYQWKGGNSSDYKRKNAPRPIPEQCEICGIPGKDLKKGLCYDHDHKTGEFRGWICMRCNFAIGLVKDNIETLKSIIDYLSKD